MQRENRSTAPAIEPALFSVGINRATMRGRWLGARLRQHRDAARLTGGQVANRIRRSGVVFGGPPCQGFSVGGHIDPDDLRNALVSQFVRLVAELRTCLIMVIEWLSWSMGVCREMGPGVGSWRRSWPT